jgi:hypothetical protein
MIINYIFEILYAPEIGQINWKSTMVLGVLVYSFIVYAVLIAINKNSIVIPIFTPIFLIAFYYYYKIQAVYLKKSKAYPKIPWFGKGIMWAIIIIIILFH